MAIRVSRKTIRLSIADRTEFIDRTSRFVGRLKYPERDNFDQPVARATVNILIGRAGGNKSFHDDLMGNSRRVLFIPWNRS